MGQKLNWGAAFIGLANALQTYAETERRKQEIAEQRKIEKERFESTQGMERDRMRQAQTNADRAYGLQQQEFETAYPKAPDIPMLGPGLSVRGSYSPGRISRQRFESLMYPTPGDAGTDFSVGGGTYNIPQSQAANLAAGLAEADIRADAMSSRGPAAAKPFDMAGVATYANKAHGPEEPIWDALGITPILYRRATEINRLQPDIQPEAAFEMALSELVEQSPELAARIEQEVMQVPGILGNPAEKRSALGLGFLAKDVPERAPFANLESGLAEAASNAAKAEQVYLELKRDLQALSADGKVTEKQIRGAIVAIATKYQMPISAVRGLMNTMLMTAPKLPAASPQEDEDDLEAAMSAAGAGGK